MDRAGTRAKMTTNESNAWRTLLELGAKSTSIGGKAALDLSTIRVGSKKTMVRLPGAIVGVAAPGVKTCNRRHVDRMGRPIYIVTDDWMGARDMLRRVEAGLKAGVKV